MRTVQIGSTGVRLSALGFGAASIGNLHRAIDDATARAAVDAAWAGGVRYFDTAPHYGLGLSERRLGVALAGHPRPEFTVSTKVGRLLVPNSEPTGSDLAGGGFAVPDELTRVRDYSRDGVRRSIDGSLLRLGLDRVDIAYVHDPEEHLDEALAHALPTLVELREQGVVGAVGVGMNLVDPLRRIVAAADLDVVLIAGRWTLLDRSAGVLLDECLARGISVVAGAPFNSGLLVHEWPPDGALFDYGPAAADLLARAREYAGLCRRHGATLPQAALQFPLRHGAVDCALPGIQTAAEARQDLAWFDADINDELWATLGFPVP